MIQHAAQTASALAKQRRSWRSDGRAAAAETPRGERRRPAGQNGPGAAGNGTETVGSRVDSGWVWSERYRKQCPLLSDHIRNWRVSGTAARRTQESGLKCDTWSVWSSLEKFVFSWFWKSNLITLSVTHLEQNALELGRRHEVLFGAMNSGESEPSTPNFDFSSDFGHLI